MTVLWKQDKKQIQGKGSDAFDPGAGDFFGKIKLGEAA